MADQATRPYRTEIPNMIDDLDLSPYAFRLYVHIKRIAGPNGSCYEGGRKLAERCHMSTGQVSAAKKELIEKGLITKVQKETRGGLVDEFTPVDLWQQNYARYSVQDVNGSVHTVNTNHESVHTVNESVHTVNESVHTVNVVRNHEEGTMKKGSGSRVARPAPPPKQTNLDSFNEAIVIFKELSGKTQLAPALTTLIVSRVTDITLWRAVIQGWISCGFNVQNVNDMLDWYDHPDKMKARLARNGHRATAPNTRPPTDLPMMTADSQPEKKILTVAERKRIIEAKFQTGK